MAKKNPLRAGRRAMTGAAIILAALLATLFMNGPGSGGGDSDNDGESRPADTQVSADPSAAILTSGSENAGLTDDEKAALSGNTLHVLIDDFDYLIRIRKAGDEQWTGIDLDRLLVVAAQAPGDSNGIRVRVQKRVTARASAEQKLRDALAAQGIGSDAVFESSELLEQPQQ